MRASTSPWKRATSRSRASATRSPPSPRPERPSRRGFPAGIIQGYRLGKMAEEVGLTIKDFDLTYLGAPQQLTAFETKAIDAAMTVEPWGARFEERGVGVGFLMPG